MQSITDRVPFGCRGTKASRQRSTFVGMSTIRSRELGDNLRLAMESAGLNGKRVAHLLGWPESKVSRLLTGHIKLSELDVSAFLAICHVKGGRRERLLRLAREQGTPGWLQQHGSNLPEQLTTLIDHESKAVEIFAFEPIRVPGLLQTGDYARALSKGTRTFRPVRYRSRVAVRLARRNLFSEPQTSGVRLLPARVRAAIAGRRQEGDVGTVARTSSHRCPLLRHRSGSCRQRSAHMPAWRVPAG